MPNTPLLQVVLVDPQIPPNVGNIARLCAAAGCNLLILGTPGFSLSDARMKRAGLDYWQHVHWAHQEDSDGWLQQQTTGRFHLMSAKATQPYFNIPIQAGDSVLFGKETSGLPAEWLQQYPEHSYTIPMRSQSQGVRSLNLASATAIVVYDLLRRLNAFC